MSITTILPVLQTILAGANICIIGYAFAKFLNKPHDTLETRVATLEVKQKETENALHQGNDRFRDQEDRLGRGDETFTVILHALLALIEYEIQYCIEEKKPLSEDLKKAKDDLHAYLSRR